MVPGKKHNPGNHLELLQGLANHAAEQGGCLLVDIHEYVFDEELFPGWSETYRRLWEYLLGSGDFWIGTPAEVARHWKNRWSSLVQAACGLEKGMA